MYGLDSDVNPIWSKIFDSGVKSLNLEIEIMIA